MSLDTVDEMDEDFLLLTQRSIPHHQGGAGIGGWGASLSEEVEERGADGTGDDGDEEEEEEEGLIERALSTDMVEE
jgi:hypothetical protein